MTEVPLAQCNSSLFNINSHGIPGNPGEIRCILWKTSENVSESEC